MDNKSTNINKANAYLSPQIIEHKRDHTYYVGNSGPESIQIQQIGGIKPVNLVIALPITIKMLTHSNNSIYYRYLGTPEYIMIYSSKLIRN